jgi:ABC-type lipoprotein export system ATPase subunit
MPILYLNAVSKNYLSDGLSIPALREVTLEVHAGEFLALVGPSGCGKSTLLNLAGAMDFPTCGTVFIDGVSTTGLDDAGQTNLRRERVGFVFQSFQLLHTLTAIENVELPLLLAGNRRARELAQQRLQWVELEGLGNRFPHQLSGGQMQRVAIARALVHSPKLLLADEPTGNLDTVTGGLILRLLLRLTRQHHTATIMATHSSEAAEICDTLVRLRDGHIEAVVRR